MYPNHTNISKYNSTGLQHTHCLRSPLNNIQKNCCERLGCRLSGTNQSLCCLLFILTEIGLIWLYFAMCRKYAMLDRTSVIGAILALTLFKVQALLRNSHWAGAVLSDTSQPSQSIALWMFVACNSLYSQPASSGIWSCSLKLSHLPLIAKSQEFTVEENGEHYS